MVLAIIDDRICSDEIISKVLTGCGKIDLMTHSNWGGGGRLEKKLLLIGETEPKMFHFPLSLGRLICNNRHKTICTPDHVIAINLSIKYSYSRIVGPRNGGSYDARNRAGGN